MGQMREIDKRLQAAFDLINEHSEMEPVHERIHVMQKTLYGSTTNSVLGGMFERAASSSEIDWWKFYQSIKGGD